MNKCVTFYNRLVYLPILSFITLCSYSIYCISCSLFNLIKYRTHRQITVAVKKTIINKYEICGGGRKRVC
ncbi:hypothetical protein [Epinotia aporema granulovirus]|uniref:Uncharacterized protein n=1 Tax=Epinotia aporema granulovirus TaxID=166056 RepID=K4EQ21_9BBAC|nr:hypothetical protein [Epinotia aporema granulovirus]AER41477.1 hypothetical protein [Epinotia aporema granulovirus]